MLSIADSRFDEQFGFTEDDVKELLSFYQLESHMEEMKLWYDGYRFGNADIYCPWDVVNYVDDLLSDPTASPKAYWINSSGNDLVKRFIDKADQTTKNEIEQLIAGETVEKRIRLDLTYDEIDNRIDNLWSVLFTTGYLTQTRESQTGLFNLLIPNREVREVFIYQIQQWFEQAIAGDNSTVNELYNDFIHGNSEGLQKKLTRILAQTISILDTKARNEEKENFYHGLLLGLLRSCKNWSVRSNVESGDGFADILIQPEDPDIGMVIELKYTPALGSLETCCQKALKQIKERHANRVFVCTTYGLFTDGMAKFDDYYEKGWIDKVITTNLNYRIPELLTKPYYIEANMSKYLASIIDIINHDVSVEKVRSSNEKIMDLMKRVNQE